MAERRSITDAVDMTPKLEAFIKTGMPQVTSSVTALPKASKPSAASEPVSTRQADTVVGLPATTSPHGSSQTAQARHRPRGRRPSRSPGRSEPSDTDSHTASILDDILVPLTTKLRRRTVQALRRAYLEQKLSGREPATQQEIIEAAVEEWLRANGFGEA